MAGEKPELRPIPERSNGAASHIRMLRRDRRRCARGRRTDRAGRRARPPPSRPPAPPPAPARPGAPGGSPPWGGRPTGQGGDLRRRPLDFLPRSLQPLAETELWRRDVERRDEPALEVPDRSRRTNQAKLELLVYQRITQRARGHEPLVQFLNATHRAGSQIAGR